MLAADTPRVPQGRCSLPTLRYPPWRRPWEEGSEQVAPRADFRRREGLVAADPGRRPRMRAGSGSPPEPMLAAEKNSWRRIQGGALGGRRAAGRPQGQCAPGLRFAPPLGSGSPLGRRLVLSFTGIGGEGAAPRSDGSTRRPPALLRAEGWSCRWPRSPVASHYWPWVNARMATSDWPTVAARQGQGAGGTLHRIPIRHLGNGSPLTNWKL